MRCSRTLFPFTVGLLLLGCGDEPGKDGGPDVGGGGGPFIALSRDFAGFESWESHSWETPEGAAHEPGLRTVYLNRRPASGSTEFPVGTIIVKVLAQSHDGGEQVFAVAKRGGDYNVDGARNWEWFELSRTPQSGAIILWRGLGPPVGHSYGDADNTCNTCHAAAAGNDSILSPHLSLTNF